MGLEQLSLPFGTTPPAARDATPSGEEARVTASLEQRLRRRLGRELELRLTDNRRTMISSRPGRDRWVIRLHHMFADADEATLDALARFIDRHDRRAAAALDRYIARNGDRIRTRPRRGTRIRTSGEHYDLQAIFDELNARWFEGRIETRITWGRRATVRRRRSIRLGNYRQDQGLIRINPALDQAWVPRFFVTYVVFHEMLHAALPPRTKDGRPRRHHDAEFRARERQHPDYERARRWERRNLRRLLRA